MDYPKRFAEEKSVRYELMAHRIREIVEEPETAGKFADYFVSVGGYLLRLMEICERVSDGSLMQASLEELREWNKVLYEDLLPGRYETSFANPAYVCQRWGEAFGRPLAFLANEIRSVVDAAFQGRFFPVVIRAELLVECYFCFSEEDFTAQQLEQILYWFVSDYSDEMMEERVAQMLDPTYCHARELIETMDLTDERYLYLFGQYVTENELGIARHLASLPEEETNRMADVFTEGFRMGFVNTNKDLSKKKIVNVRYHLGFERIVRKALENFREMGLEATVYPVSVSSIQSYVGYEGAVPNRQWLYDHAQDRALYLDKAYVERRLGALRQAYEKYREEAALFAGPAVMETFGEKPFSPQVKPENYELTEAQRKLATQLANETGSLVNEYVRMEERSFTIIAFPLPEIGEPFGEIFDQVVRINTLDSDRYSQIQQRIIDVLDQGEFVRVRGMNGNRTCLDVQLQELRDPDRETLFENCVADVNIPVGEVFTSPRLTGTRGLLHVKRVFLDELEYQDLELTFEDGMVTDYGCSNFEQESENRKYVSENVLHYHESLPMGEFAIGTNVTAYVFARRYGLEAKLPILIAEKTGPHFAVGDTCYSWSEDVPVHNPNGKEIIARDNERTLCRREDPGKAYFNCHTDVTIPYDELGSLTVVTKTGENIDIIIDGRFVLEGTESLNDAFIERRTL